MSIRFGAKTNLSIRSLTYYALAYLVLIGLMGFIVDRSIRSALISEVDDNLVVAARLAWESLPEEEGDYQDWAEATFQATGYRATLIAADGLVLADSHSDPAVMENHASRPEVQDALNG